MLELLNRLFLEFSPKSHSVTSDFFWNLASNLSRCVFRLTSFILQSSICFQLFLLERPWSHERNLESSSKFNSRRGHKRMKKCCIPIFFQQILILWHFSLRYFIFSWRFYNAAWIFQNQFRKFWFHILSRATLPYLELSKCQIENRAPSDQNILSHFYS